MSTPNRLSGTQKIIDSGRLVEDFIAVRDLVAMNRNGCEFTFSGKRNSNIDVILANLCTSARIDTWTSRAEWTKSGYNVTKS